MVDYTQGTGTAGTLTIRDTGSTVEYWIGCTDPATNTGGLPWTATGTAGGTAVLSAGFTYAHLGTATISTSQNVTFTIAASGTMGLGGPTSFTQFIARATVPPAPTMRAPDQITTTGMRVQFDSNGDGGSAITSWGLQSATDSGFTQNVSLIGSTGTTIYTGLTPGQRYWFRARGQNAVGVGSFSSSVNAITLTAVWVSDGAVWKSSQAFVSDGAVWKPTDIFVSDGSVWKPTG